MKIYLKTGLFLIYILLIISCSQKKSSPEEFSYKETSKKITLCFEDAVEFRRTYASIQFIFDKKAVARYIKKQDKSNPELVYGENSSLIKRFEELGFVKGDELLENKFKYNTKKEFHYINNSGKEITTRFERDTAGLSTGKIVVIEGRDSASINITDFPMDLKYAFLNIIPGGNKEIVVLNETYFMNGYNFDFSVYEITWQ